MGVEAGYEMHLAQEIWIRTQQYQTKVQAGTWAGTTHGVEHLTTLAKETSIVMRNTQ